MFRKYYVHLFLICLGVVLYFFANFQRVAIPGAVFSLLQQKLNITAPYITALGAVFMYTYAVSQIFMGRVVERYGGLRIIALGAVFFSVGSLIFPNTDSLYLLYFSRIMLGFGSGCFYLSIVRELERCFSKKDFGIVLSITIFIGYSGSFAANAPFVYAIDKFGFAHTLDYIALVILTVSVFFILFGSRYSLTKIKTDRHIDLIPYKEVLSSKYNINLFIFGSLNYALMYVLQTIVGKKFLEDFCSFSSSDASWVLSAMSIISAFFSMGLAFLSRAFGGRKIIFFKIASVLTVFSFAFVIASLVFETGFYMVAVLFCCLAAVASMSPLLVMVINDVNRHSVSVTAVGLMNAMFFFAVGIMGNITGFMMNIFPTVNLNGLHIYGKESYLAVFVPFFLLSLAEMYYAYKLYEPGIKE